MSADVTPEAWEARKAFVGFGPRDVAALRALRLVAQLARLRARRYDPRP